MGIVNSMKDIEVYNRVIKSYLVTIDLSIDNMLTIIDSEKIRRLITLNL